LSWLTFWATLYTSPKDAAAFDDRLTPISRRTYGVDLL